MAIINRNNIVTHELRRDRGKYSPNSTTIHTHNVEYECHLTPIREGIHTTLTYRGKDSQQALLELLETEHSLRPGEIWNLAIAAHGGEVA